MAKYDGVTAGRAGAACCKRCSDVPPSKCKNRLAAGATTRRRTYSARGDSAVRRHQSSPSRSGCSTLAGKNLTTFKQATTAPANIPADPYVTSYKTPLDTALSRQLICLRKIINYPTIIKLMIIIHYALCTIQIQISCTPYGLLVSWPSGPTVIT